MYACVEGKDNRRLRSSTNVWFQPFINEPAKHRLIRGNKNEWPRGWEDEQGRDEQHLLQPVSFILAPALMKSAYWDWRMPDGWHSRASDLTLHQSTHSEWAVTQVHDSLWSTGISVATLDLRETAIDVLAPLTGIHLIVRRNGYK